MIAAFHLALITKWMLINEINNIDIKIDGDNLNIRFDDHTETLDIHNTTALNLVDELVNKYDEIILGLND